MHYLRYYEDFAIDLSKGASNFTQLLVQEALEYVTRLVFFNTKEVDTSDVKT